MPTGKGKEDREDGKKGLDLARFRSSLEMSKTGPSRNTTNASPIPSNVLHRSDRERRAIDKGLPEKVEASRNAAQGRFGGDDASVVVTSASKVRQG
ncbi:hypothetical protein U1Q18_043109 [Sarracenia purpurea var. burkii]